MLVTRQIDYALRIVRALHRQELLTAAAIAEKESMPRAITLKLLRLLTAAGLVDSRRGASGGYVLARPCRELTLLDVFRAVGEPPRVNRCQDRGYWCENRPDRDCGLCREFDRVQAVLTAELSRTPLSEIVPD